MRRFLAQPPLERRVRRLAVPRRLTFNKEMTMTKEEALAKLAECQKSNDTEVAHSDADDVLCDLLDELGYGDVVAEYHKVSKWFS
jgi:hypothetical protein